MGFHFKVFLNNFNVHSIGLNMTVSSINLNSNVFVRIIKGNTSPRHVIFICIQVRNIFFKDNDVLFFQPLAKLFIGILTNCISDTDVLVLANHLALKKDSLCFPSFMCSINVENNIFVSLDIYKAFLSPIKDDTILL